MNGQRICDIYVCVYVYYIMLLSYKNNEILPFVITWMNLYDIMQSEKNHTEKDKYHVIALIYVEYKKQKNEQTEKKSHR